MTGNFVLVYRLKTLVLGEKGNVVVFTSAAASHCHLIEGIIELIVLNKFAHKMFRLIA